MNRGLMVLLTVAAAAAACGDAEIGAGEQDSAIESAAEQEPWDTDALAGCDLVTEQVIAEALREAVIEKEEGGWYGCRWKTESSIVGLTVFADTSLPDDSCAVGGTSMPYGKSAMGQQEAITALGDEAIWGSSGDLLVCTGRGMLNVNMERTPPTMAPPEAKEVAIVIARSALSRLEAAGQ